MVLQHGEGFGDAIHHVRVAAIEADADVVEMHGADELDEALGSGKFVGNIFHKHSYAERLGEGAQVLDAGHGGFEFLFVEGFVGIADVLDEKAERDVLGDSRERLISSMASMRPARSVEAMLTGGEPVRPHS